LANSIIVIGAQWGDEGKGKIIDLLTIKSDAVVRFQGGHNAGHTLVIEGNETILHLIPSGIFNNVDCIIANGVVLHLPTLFEEIDSLKEKGVAIEKNLHISTLCPLILPSHIALDEVKEKNLGSKAIGTTGRGIGPAYEDKIARRAIHLVDLFHEEYFLEKLKELMEFHNFLLVNLYKTKPINVQTVADEWLTHAEQVQPFVTDTTHLLHSINSSDSNILFEGAQGTMLDIDHGTYPFVTSSNTVAGAASTGTGLGPGDFNHVLGIIKAYTIRVGSGPFPSELFDENGEHLGRVGVEFGATTGRARRCGWLDAVAPNSTPTLPKCSPFSSKSSEGNGPEPTLIV
jgi:adenylosuccinate synthase